VTFTVASLNGLLLTKLQKREYQVLNYNKCNQRRRKKGKHFTPVSGKLECKKVLWWLASQKPRKCNVCC